MLHLRNLFTKRIQFEKKVVWKSMYFRKPKYLHYQTFSVQTIRLIEFKDWSKIKRNSTKAKNAGIKREDKNDKRHKTKICWFFLCAYNFRSTDIIFTKR